MPYRNFSLNKASEYLHLSEDEIERLVRQHEIPFEHKGPQLSFRKIDLDAWASKRILAFSEKHLDAYHKTSSSKTDDLSVNRVIISRLTKKAAVKVDIQSKTKPSLLRDMVALAEKTSLVPNPGELLESLVLRENMCSTALADGLALLHPRHHEPYMLEGSFIAFGRTIRPIPFGASDGKESDLFFLICCQNDRLHLHVLARLCMMCRNKAFLISLRNAVDGNEICDLIRRQELEAIKQTGAPHVHR